MRKYVLLLAGVCFLHTAVSAAPFQAAGGGKPTTPQTAKPAAEAGQPNADKKEVKVAEKVLQTYEGQYEMGPDRILTVKLDKGYLWGEPTGQQARQIFPESETKFFLKDLDVQIEFQKDAKGVVTGMVMTQRGENRELKKVK